MKKLILLSSVFFFFLLTAFSQKQEKSSLFRNRIGMQLNPYIDQNFFDFTIMNTVTALRYSHTVTKNITTGLEFSCNFPVNTARVHNFQIYNYFIYKFGIITRYSFLMDKRIQIFAEASPYFSHFFRERTILNDNSSYKENKLGFYAAPGFTIYTKNKRISFDLYYKFSNLTFVNGKKSVFSYKVNYNF
jgi:hypothetical protein